MSLSTLAIGLPATFQDINDLGMPRACTQFFKCEFGLMLQSQPKPSFNCLFLLHSKFRELKVQSIDTRKQAIRYPCNMQLSAALVSDLMLSDSVSFSLSVEKEHKSHRLLGDATEVAKFISG